MTDFQFQLLIGTILGSMLLIILAVVIAARVLYLETKDIHLSDNQYLSRILRTVSKGK